MAVNIQALMERLLASQAGLPGQAVGAFFKNGQDPYANLMQAAQYTNNIGAINQRLIDLARQNAQEDADAGLMSDRLVNDLGRNRSALNRSFNTAVGDTTDRMAAQGILHSGAYMDKLGRLGNQYMDNLSGLEFGAQSGLEDISRGVAERRRMQEEQQSQLAQARAQQDQQRLLLEAYLKRQTEYQNSLLQAWQQQMQQSAQQQQQQQQAVQSINNGMAGYNAQQNAIMNQGSLVGKIGQNPVTAGPQAPVTAGPQTPSTGFEGLSSGLTAGPVNSTQRISEMGAPPPPRPLPSVYPSEESIGPTNQPSPAELQAIAARLNEIYSGGGYQTTRRR